MEFATTTLKSTMGRPSRTVRLESIAENCNLLASSLQAILCLFDLYPIGLWITKAFNLSIRLNVSSSWISEAFLAVCQNAQWFLLLSSNQTQVSQSDRQAGRQAGRHNIPKIVFPLRFLQNDWLTFTATSINDWSGSGFLSYSAILQQSIEMQRYFTCVSIASNSNN